MLKDMNSGSDIMPQMHNTSNTKCISISQTNDVQS